MRSAAEVIRTSLSKNNCTDDGLFATRSDHRDGDARIRGRMEALRLHRA